MALCRRYEADGTVPVLIVVPVDEPIDPLPGGSEVFERPLRIARSVFQGLEHNRVLLEALRATLQADGAWRDGSFDAYPTRAVKAFAHVYAGWALSQAFYGKRVWAEHGYESLEDFLVRGWEQRFLSRDPRDLLSMIKTWLHSDISDNDRYDGDLTRALGAITARTLVMRASSDPYFMVEDSRRETALMRHVELRVIESIWGHRAGNAWQCPHDGAVIRVAVQKLPSNDGA